mgnify:CR=1 FL=1
MNFNVDEVMASLGFEDIEDVPFEEVAMIDTSGNRIICYHYNVNAECSLIGFPFVIKRNERGQVHMIERYNMLSDELFFIIRNSAIVSMGPLSLEQMGPFSSLCESLIKVMDEKMKEYADNYDDPDRPEDSDEEVDLVDYIEDLKEGLLDKKKLH